MSKKRALILGIGNLLLGDEGVGVQAVQELEKHILPTGVDILDGGTGGFHLLAEIEQYPYVVLIDATMDGQKAGTVSLIKPKFASDYPPSLSAHDIGLKDLIESLYLTGKVPEIYLVAVSIEGIQAMTMELSKPVKSAIGDVIEKINYLFHSGEIDLNE